MQEPKRCGARTRSGRPCRNWPTKSNGKRCRLHGGGLSASGRGSGGPIKHGRYSVVAKRGLLEKFKEFMADPEYADLKAELAMQRALFAQELERMGGEPGTPVDSGLLFGLLDSITKSVDRLARIESRTALTASELRLLEVVITGLLAEIVPPQEVAQFVTRLDRALATRSESMALIEARCSMVGSPSE